MSYPSLCDNNILRGCLVTEVLYWAHKLRGRRRLESGDEGSPVGQEQDGAAGETGQTGDEREQENDSILSLWSEIPLWIYIFQFVSATLALVFFVLLLLSFRTFLENEGRTTVQ